MGRGRPVKYTPELIAEVQEKLDAYVEENPIPIVAEFAYKNDIRKATLYEIPALAYSIKRLTEKKEAQLEKLALAGKTNTTFAIFSLKQLGWSDKQERLLKTIDDEGNETGFKLVAPPDAST